MGWYRPTTTADKVFAGGIVIKGITGALEFLGGLLLLFFSPAVLHQFTVLITSRELIEDPHDRIANLLLGFTQNLGTGSRVFLIVYLWIHAAIKLIAVLGILRNLLWAYPFSLITLGLLLLYQLYVMIFVQFSAGLLFLSIFDVIVLGLIGYEYRHMLTRANQD